MRKLCVNGGLLLTQREVEGLQFLLLKEQRRVVDIHATTSEAVNHLVSEWERIMGLLPEDMS